MAATRASAAKKASKAAAARAAALTPALPTTVLPAAAPPTVTSPAAAPPATAPPATVLPAAALPAAGSLPAAAPSAAAPHVSKGRRCVQIETPEYVSSGDTKTASSSHKHSCSTKDKLAYLRKQMDRYRVQKACARKACSHRCCYQSSGSSSSSSDSEGYGPRVSFKDNNEGNKPFLKLHERYRAVNVKYFKQIYFGKFQPKHLTRLAHNYFNWSMDKKDKKDDDVQEATGLNQLLRCFDVYCQAICYFASWPHVALKLHKALIDY